MWEHYRYTCDLEFLKNEGYEFIRQAAIFFLDNLVEDKNGYLVYGPSTSPENHPAANSGCMTVIGATRKATIAD